MGVKEALTGLAIIAVVTSCSGGQNKSSESKTPSTPVTRNSTESPDYPEIYVPDYVVYTLSDGLPEAVYFSNIKDSVLFEMFLADSSITSEARTVDIVLSTTEGNGVSQCRVETLKGSNTGAIVRAISIGNILAINYPPITLELDGTDSNTLIYIGRDEYPNAIQDSTFEYLFDSCSGISGGTTEFKTYTPGLNGSINESVSPPSKEG